MAARLPKFKEQLLLVLSSPERSRELDLIILMSPLELEIFYNPMIQ